MNDLALGLGALIVIVALSWANRHHAHIWRDDDRGRR